jgi:cytochrome b
MASVRVWDPFVRIVHWSVAVLIAIDLLNDAGANPWHRYFGYVAGALVLLRLAWGFFAPPHARLSAMAESARTLMSYIADLRTGSHRFYAGHNPAGACMAFTLWTLLLLIVITGWMLQLDAFWGDELLQTAHAVAAYVLAALAVVHVSGALVTSAVTRTNLVKAMITGEKTLREPPAS